MYIGILATSTCQKGPSFGSVSGYMGISSSNYMPEGTRIQQLVIKSTTTGGNMPQHQLLNFPKSTVQGVRWQKLCASQTQI